METIKHKRGDTLRWPCVRTDAAGDPVDLTGQTITANFKRGSTEISLGVTVTDEAAGEYDLTADKATTKAWAAAVYVGDVTFENAFGASSTETFALVLEDGYFDAP